MSSVATISAVAAIGGSMISANAQSKAASGAQNATNSANALQSQMYNQNRADQTPWRSTGGAAMGQLSSLMGINSQNTFNQQKYLSENPDANARIFQSGQTPYEDYMAHFGANDPNAAKYFNQGADFGSGARDFSMADYQADPGYQFRLEQGAKALERSGAGRGMALSGAQLKGLTDYNSGMASQEYGNAYNRFMNNRTTRFNELGTLAGLGQTSTAQVGQAGQNAATNMGSNLTNNANFQGAAGIAGANTWSGALNSMGNSWQDYVRAQQADVSKMG